MNEIYFFLYNVIAYVSSLQGFSVYIDSWIMSHCPCIRYIIHEYSTERDILAGQIPKLLFCLFLLSLIYWVIYIYIRHKIQANLH